MVVVAVALLALVLPHRAFPAAPRAPSPLLLGDAPGAASIAAATAARAEAASKALADAAQPASEFLLDATRPAIDAATPVLDPVLRATEQARVQWQLYGSEHPAEQVGLGLSALLLLELVREVVAAGGDERPYPRDAYDPDAARAFFVRRPLEVLARAVELGVRSAGFGGALLSDWLAGPAALEANAEERALQLAKVLTALGPTFIKAGQSASIRTDLLAPPYIRGLTSLQDQAGGASRGAGRGRAPPRREAGSSPAAPLAPGASLPDGRGDRPHPRGARRSGGRRGATGRLAAGTHPSLRPPGASPEP